ncbi:hypothetical protein [Henriciella aquimarina]|uniref:hypothetical protein n=1 Tax=Henriciella aquimarina TaxID=545261 RepID=UPI00117B2EB1|nr:hypothetical protein [Henriciella aquimarina]
MRKYIVMVLIHAGDETEAWTEWAKKHAADMIKVPGFLTAQAFVRRREFSFEHGEVIPTLPPYDLMTWYEVDEEGMKFLSTNERPKGSPPMADSAPFPTPLGGYTGNEYLWEAITPEYHAVRELPISKKRFVTVLTDTSGNREDWPEWGADHVHDMIKMDIFHCTQAFKALEFKYAHKDTAETQPPYDLLTFYEVNDHGYDFLTTHTRPPGEGPQAGTRPFPSELGKHVGDTFMWEAITQEYRPSED